MSVNTNNPHHATASKPLARPMVAKKAVVSNGKSPFQGEVQVPGDKSISHRALIFAALAEGESRITGLLEGEDVLCTAASLRAMGVSITRTESKDSAIWHVTGVGLKGLREPDDVLNVGNSGTSARLFLGLLAGQNITAFVTGDDSLRKRPMARVTKPLEAVGAKFVSRTGGLLPVVVVARESGDIAPIQYTSPIASAQVKSALLLAGLPHPQVTEITEPRQTRDHTERFLAGFGVPIETTPHPDGSHTVRITGGHAWKGFDLMVPSDISSAAFIIVEALLIQGSNVLIRHVGLNPTRTGIIDTLKDMGGDITIENARVVAGEPVGDIRVRYSKLHGVDVPEDRIPSMIDECPILAVAAACAMGITRLTGIGELRVKESDRLAMMANGLKSCGVNLEEESEGLIIHGTGLPPKVGATGVATIKTALDHRIAMSFLVLGQVTDQPIMVDDTLPIATSFPTFVQMMRDLGGILEEV